MQIELRKQTKRFDAKNFFLPAVGQERNDNFLSQQKPTANGTEQPDGMRTPIQNPRYVSVAIFQYNYQRFTERVFSILYSCAKFSCAKTLL